MAVCNSADGCRRVVTTRDTLTYLLRGCRRRGRMPGRRCQRKEDPLRAEGVVLGIPVVTPPWAHSAHLGRRMR